MILRSKESNEKRLITPIQKIWAAIGSTQTYKMLHLWHKSLRQFLSQEVKGWHCQGWGIKGIHC